MNSIRVQDLIAAVFLVGGIWLSVSAAFGGAWFTSMTWFLSGVAMTSLWLLASDIVDVRVVVKRVGRLGVPGRRGR